jgi:FkbM family methyltransferase
MSISFPCENIELLIDPSSKSEWNSINNKLKTRPMAEAFFRRIIYKLITMNIIDKRKSFIDLGAWIGDNSLVWAKMITGIVYAIDPSNNNCDYINYMSKLNGIKNIKTVCRAINSKVEVISTDSSMQHCTFQHNSTGKHKMLTTTLDKLDLKDIGFIHLDVEGMESDVIEGGINLIKKSRPVVAFEQHLDSDDYKGLSNTMKSMNYKVYMITETMPHCNVDCRNFISIPNEKLTNIDIATILGNELGFSDILDVQ